MQGFEEIGEGLFEEAFRISNYLQLLRSKASYSSDGLMLYPLESSAVPYRDA